jgi:hypothetical protein
MITQVRRETFETQPGREVDDRHDRAAQVHHATHPRRGHRYRREGPVLGDLADAQDGNAVFILADQKREQLVHQNLS